MAHGDALQAHYAVSVRGVSLCQIVLVAPRRYDGCATGQTGPTLSTGRPLQAVKGTKLNGKCQLAVQVDMHEAANWGLPRAGLSSDLEEDKERARKMVSGEQQLVSTFAKCKASGRVAFVGYLTAGYFEKDDTIPLLLAMQEGGADVIEVPCLISHSYCRESSRGVLILRKRRAALLSGDTLLVKSLESSRKHLSIPPRALNACLPSSRASSHPW